MTRPTPRGRAALDAEPGLLASAAALSSLSLAASAAGGGLPHASVPESEFFAGRRFSVSDAPFPLLPSPAAAGPRLAPAMVMPAVQGGGTPVTWQNAVGVTASAGSLTKTAATGWGNSGASSTQSIPSGGGYVEFTFAASSDDAFVGLSNGDGNQMYDDVDFALYASAYNGGAVYVFEGAANRGVVSTFTAGDRFRVAVEGGAVRYYKVVGGAPSLLYTSTVQPQYPLLVDTALHWTGDQVTDVRLSSGGGGGGSTGTGLTGKYYDNIDLTGYKVTRADPTVDFEWHGAAPHPSLGPDTFSVVWTGMVRPRYTETYTFYTQSDDGVRLWVDGQLLVDKWVDQGWTEWSGTITLEADRPYSVRMEFYENGGGAIAKLLWSSATQQPKEVVPQSRLDACFKTVEQFVRDFYWEALVRLPHTTELQDWTARLALAQDDVQLVAEARALGRAVFESQEYLNRNPDNGNPNNTNLFVSDLYRGYMQRAPDAAGLAWWAGQVSQHGRQAGIAAFEGSGEFIDKVRRLCGTSASAGASGYDFAVSRLEADNATGGGGVNARSRNFNWGVPLVTLPGRAGLDLDISLSYNSLVWTKDATGQAVAFDADFGNPSPGFRLGFPVVQPRYYNGRRGRDAFMMITPSGGRAELLRVGSSNVYESADSKYLRLTDHGTWLTVLTTDGSQLSFALRGGDFQCTEVKDRNGNYITVNYNQYGQVSTVVDTLGRTVTFNYDSNQNLISITQPWKRELDDGSQVTETHAWATFGYENVTLQPSFDNLAVMGTQAGAVIPVLKQVGLADGSYYKFYYAPSGQVSPFGQVYKITRFAADSVVNGSANDSHPLSSVRYNLPGSDLAGVTPQTDCPRFTEVRAWAEYGVADVQQSQEVVTGYSVWTPNAASCDVTLPDPTPGQPGDEVTHKEFYATTLWQKGLVTRSEVWAGGALKKWTELTWEHDGGAGDQHAVNPRVRETAVNDSDNNRRHTEVAYTSYGLPGIVWEKSDATTVLRRTEVDYRIHPTDDAAYLNRRLIGLVKERRLYAGSGALAAKVGYVYDDASGQDFLQALPSPAAQHDAAYSTAFTTRGNVNRVRRYDVNSPNSFVESQMGYNVAGSAVLAKDAAGHKTSVGYADSFYAGENRSTPQLQTYAYPTSVTVHETVPVVLDVAMTTEYNYDLGASVIVTAPKGGITSFQPGPQMKRYFDAAGRVQKVVNLSTGAHTERAYDAGSNAVQTRTTVSDASVADPAQRAFSVTVMTGDGRVRGTAQDLPVPGTYGRYTGVRVLYDALGRAEYQTNPTEVTTGGGVWSPAGDDHNGGQWRWARQQYDWMGRPSVNTGVEGHTRESIYGGCGCAGGAVVTSRDEVGRRSRVTFDALGRVWKSQVLSVQDKAQQLSHGTDADVYSTTINTFNALDRTTQVEERAGAAGSAQLTTMEYDGHGRLWRKHNPEQDAGRYSTYTYTPDDKVETFTDARGSRTVYGYNDRHLTTSVSYDTAGVIPGQDVAAAAGTVFQYNADGTRRQMDDGPGSIEYAYDQHGRLETERRYFDGLGGTPFQITYGYTLAGALKSVKDPWNEQVDYGMDDVGRLFSVTGTAFGGVTQYVAGTQAAPGILYRAWGGVKHVNYGDSRTLDITYNPRLQPDTLTVPGLMSKRYEYHADGMLRYTQDLLAPRFDRSYSYDLAGRMAAGYSGPEARGEADTNIRPYRQTFQYDEWDNLTSRTTRLWSTSGGVNFPDPQVYVNNRVTGLRYDGTPAWRYNADGDVTDSYYVTYVYDAAGDVTRTISGNTDLTQSYDGDGRRAKATEVNTYYNDELSYTETETADTYFIHSTALGGALLSEVGAAGQKQRTFVYMGGRVLAWQVRPAQGADYVRWEHRDTSNASVRVTNSAGASISDDAAELDPLGADAGLSDPNEESRLLSRILSKYPGHGSSYNTGKSQCFVDFMERPCSEAMWMIGNGTAAVCPNNYCGPTYNPENRRFEIPYLQHNGFVRVGLGSPTPILKHAPATPEQKQKDRQKRGKDREDKEGKGKGNSEEKDGEPPAFSWDVPVPDVLLDYEQDCLILVSFKGQFTAPGQASGLANGPGVIIWDGRKNLGLGFTVSGSVAQGGIGKIGNSPNSDNPGGSWAIEQWVHDYDIYDGRSHLKLRQELSENAPVHVKGNQFSWYDHPGIQIDSPNPKFEGYYRRAKFTVKVTNGETQCAVKFSLRMDHIKGTWYIKWAPGHY